MRSWPWILRTLQVLHEALDQPGGLVALADYVASRLGEEQVLIARDLRQFKEHSSRDMQRERRMMCQRLVRPRLEEPEIKAGDLQDTFEGLLKREALPMRQVRKTRLSQNLTLEVGNPLQVAEEERMRWAMTLSQFIVAAELPVVGHGAGVRRSAKELGQNLRQPSCQDFEKQGVNMEEVLHLAPLESSPSLACEDWRCGGLFRRKNRGRLWTCCAPGIDGGRLPYWRLWGVWRRGRSYPKTGLS